MRKAVTKQRAFRCRSCAWRGFGEDTGPTFRPEEIELAYRAVARDDQSWATGDTFRDLDLVTMGAQTEPIGPLGAEPA